MIETINRNKHKITIDCGKVNGKRKRISKIFIGNKTDAKIFESELKKEILINTNNTNRYQTTTFYSLIDMYLEHHCKTKLKDNTIYGYKFLLKVIKSEIKDIEVKKITPLLLEEYYSILNKKYNYSSNTIIHHYNLLNNIFEQAVKWEIINRNPNTSIDKPKLVKKEAKFYDKKEIDLLLNCLNKEPLMHKTPILLCLDTGMRREELNGLLWKDIDFDNNIVDINKVRIAVGKEIIVEEPKTKNSKRKIYFTELSKESLKALKKEQQALYKSLGKTWSEYNYVFINYKDGKEIYPDTLSKVFKKILKRYGLREITFHQLRHTNATLLINSNVDINTVSERLGHSNVATTLNVYTHVLDDTKKQVADKMNEILTIS